MRFLTGMNPMISSRNCTLQQSSVDCRDQCVRMKVQNVYTRMQGTYFLWGFMWNVNHPFLRDFPHYKNLDVLWPTTTLNDLFRSNSPGQPGIILGFSYI